MDRWVTSCSERLPAEVTVAKQVQYGTRYCWDRCTAPVLFTCNTESQYCGAESGPQGFGSGSAWIRINLSCWIRIRIQIADPDPGGQK